MDHKMQISTQTSSDEINYLVAQRFDELLPIIQTFFHSNSPHWNLIKQKPV